MRVRLRKGKQRALLYLARTQRGCSWTALAAEFGVARTTLKDWELEKNLLPISIFRKLDEQQHYKQFVVEYLPEHWGQQQGGEHSKGRTKNVPLPQKSAQLAELCGIILGDGNINAFHKGKKVATYTVKIAGDSRHDRAYLRTVVKPLIQNIFQIHVREYSAKHANCHYLIADGIQLIAALRILGLKSGNKLHNQQGIPRWILQKKSYLRSCIRGLIDTDGSVMRMSQRDAQLMRIGFRSYIPPLLQQVYRGLQALGFHPHISQKHHQLFLSRQHEIQRYVVEIGFHNEKHLKRLKEFSK